ncbi:MAG: hypothetical protein AAF654_15070 [Myxococcota bacterium]
MSETVENHPYRKAGLPSVTLRNLKTRRCAACGHMLVAIPRQDELHAVIAACLVLKPSRLQSEEIRGLRGFMKLSGRALARRLHVEPEQVSRWESNTKPQPIGKTSETALRLLAFVSLCGNRIDDFPSKLETLTFSPSQEPFRVVVDWLDNQWRENRDTL